MGPTAHPADRRCPRHRQLPSFAGVWASTSTPAAAAGVVLGARSAAERQDAGHDPCAQPAALFRRCRGLRGAPPAAVQLGRAATPPHRLYQLRALPQRGRALPTTGNSYTGLGIDGLCKPTGSVNNSVRVRSGARLSPPKTTSSGQTGAYRAWCASNTIQSRVVKCHGVAIHSTVVHIHTELKATTTLGSCTDPNPRGKPTAAPAAFVRPL